MNTTLKRIFSLTALCVKTKSGKIGIAYCAFVLLLNLVEIRLALLMITWNKSFYGALEKYDAAAALTQIGIFAAITAANSLQYLVATYVRGLVQIRWRTILTEHTLARWFANKAFWHIKTEGNSVIDNPDQRISEDCRLFIDRLTGRGLDLFTGLVGLATYAFLLWKLSDFAITLTVFGHALTIEHYLVWAAPLYVLVSSGLTHWMGSPLMKLNVIAQKREADMRFALARVRESAEAIALLDGEDAEKGIIRKRYAKIVENWRARLNREFILGLFTRPYYMTVLRIPLFLSFPAYLMGHVALGGLMQLGSAFTRLVTTLSWFIFSYRELAELSATANRIATFLAQANEAASLKSPVEVTPSGDGRLAISHLCVKSPTGEKLATLEDITLSPGEALWIDGPSGIGKSTLIKAICGIWPHAEGKMARPKGHMLFLPQKAYLPLGSLAETIGYPHRPPEEGVLVDMAESVGLSATRHIKEIKSGEELSSDFRLSGGEQQRLMAARILAAKPDWLFLDEATASLDEKAEEALYRVLRSRLPHTGLVVVAHREPRGLGSYRRVSLWKDSA